MALNKQPNASNFIPEKWDRKEKGHEMGNNHYHDSDVIAFSAGV
ncbi:MAG: hypothetical protein UT48_C0019G0011 [Parcubacteria group bacterium GW2011_GWE2_39_37]|nr:MAG: hypothetical protein UT48_C0019G0011 [Parcubacteria group bacterium GW2011_GWE2_39_37]